MYPPKLQMNKANDSDTEASFSDLHLSISDRFVTPKLCDKRDNVLDGNVPRSASSRANISQILPVWVVICRVHG